MSKPWGLLRQVFVAFSEYINFKGHYRNQGLKVTLVTKYFCHLQFLNKYSDIIFVAVTRFKRIHHDWCSKLFSCFKGKTFLAVKCLKFMISLYSYCFLFFLFNPNWHEGRYFSILVFFGSDFSAAEFLSKISKLFWR